MAKELQVSSLSLLSHSNLMSASSSLSLSIAFTRYFSSSINSVSSFSSIFLPVWSFAHFPSPAFSQEPELLRVDAERIRRQMQEVAVANYRSFISAADALVSIREEVSSIDNHLESLVISLPDASFQFWMMLFKINSVLGSDLGMKYERCLWFVAKTNME